MLFCAVFRRQAPLLLLGWSPVRFPHLLGLALPRYRSCAHFAWSLSNIRCSTLLAVHSSGMNLCEGGGGIPVDGSDLRAGGCFAKFHLLARRARARTFSAVMREIMCAGSRGIRLLRRLSIAHNFNVQVHILQHARSWMSPLSLRAEAFSPPALFLHPPPGLCLQ